MVENETPLIRFGTDTDNAPTLNYNIPQSTSYPSRSIFILDYPSNWFQEETKRQPDNTLRSVESLDISSLVDRIKLQVRQGLVPDEVLLQRVNIEDPIILTAIRSDPTILARIGKETKNLTTDGGTLHYESKADLLDAIQKTDYLSTASFLSLTRSISPETIAAHAKQGEYLTFERNLYGDYVPTFLPEPSQPQPQLAIVERYQISNYLGNYGAGRTVKTFSLFPGERTNISIKKYSNRERQKQEASSLLEAASREAATEFEKAVETESATRSAIEKQKTSYWEASGGLGVNLGFFNIGGGGGGGGTSRTNAARETTAQTATRAVNKHASESSAKREMNINTSGSFIERTGEEESIIREIENINVSRTLNLVFRQMIQEFISVFHLVDIRLAYTNGYSGTYREVSIPRMDDLINDVFVEGSVDGEIPRDVVKENLITQLTNIYDYKDKLAKGFVTQTSRENEESYWRINKNKYSTYSDRSTSTKIKVPGLILSTTKNTLNTDDLIVDALLGRGEALDAYSRALQSEAAESQELENNLMNEEVQKSKLAREIINDENTNNAEQRAKIFEKIFPNLEDGQNLSITIKNNDEEL